MSDPKSEARINRLLGGEFRPDDITHLLLYARDHCDGREALADIGHFVAHHHERDKGIVTRLTREWFTTVRFHMARYSGNGFIPLNPLRLPAVAQDYLKTSVNRIGAKDIHDKTGLRLKDAHVIINKFAARLTKNPDGTWMVPADATEKEWKLFECVSSFIISKPAFDSEHLSNDFVETLKSNGLLTKDQIREHRGALSSVLQMFAISIMHNCKVKVKVGEGEFCVLKANVDKKTNCIYVLAPVVGLAPGNPTISLTAPIYVSNLDYRTHCHPELHDIPEWNFEIEVNRDKMLAALR